MCILTILANYPLWRVDLKQNPYRYLSPTRKIEKLLRSKMSVCSGDTWTVCVFW